MGTTAMGTGGNKRPAPRSLVRHHHDDDSLSDPNPNGVTLPVSTATQASSADTFHRIAEFAFGATLVGVGAIAFAAGSFVVGAGVVEAIGGVATGPGELLVAPHAVAVGSFALFVMLPVSGFLVGAGIRTIHDALTP